MPSSIPLPSLKFGKRKGRSLICEVFTEDGRWFDKELPVELGCVDSSAPVFAGIIDPENQFQAADGTWHQLISEKSDIPICLRKKSIYEDGNQDEEDKKKVRDGIFRVAFKKEQAEALENAKASEAWNRLTAIVTIVCVTLFLIVGMTFLRGCG